MTSLHFPHFSAALHQLNIFILRLLSALIISILLLEHSYASAQQPPSVAEITADGFVQKLTKINQISLSYQEGPNNGPALILLHAQLLDWFSYHQVLPQLAKSFHVYDIDYPGHGSTTTPADYSMTANQIGTDLADFIQQKIGEKVFITGNSSGGLLATWLAANRPQLVKAVVLEDPPLFSSEYPRIKTTIAYRAFYTSYMATKQHLKDFLMFWLTSNAEFFRKHIGRGSVFMLRSAIKTFKALHPDQPVDLPFIKNDTVRMLIRGLSEYDPRFGAAFYDGSWNQGFDHAQALSSIKCPVLLMQANFSIMDDGTLNGAMTTQDAKRATALLKFGHYLKVDATHVINIDKPTLFVDELKKFFLNKP